MKEFYRTILVFAVIFMVSSIDVLSSDKWTHFKVINGNQLSTIKSIEIDDFENVYIVDSQRVIKITNDNLIDITNYDYSENFYSIRKIEFSKSKILWGASENGLMKYLPENNSMNFFNRKEIMGDWDYEFILSLAINEESVWFVSRNPYLTVFDGQQFTDFDIYGQNKIIDLHFIKVPLIIDRNKDIWIGGQDGILKFSSKSTKDNMIYTKFSLKEIAFEGKVESLIEDDFGNIFATGMKGELSIYKNDNWFPVTIPEEFKAEKLNANDPNYITTIGIDNSKSIKLFWHSADFYLSVDSNMTFTKINFPKDIIPSKTTVSSFKCDLNNNLWFGTVQNGLIKYSKNTTDVEDNDIIINNSLREEFIRNIYPNPSNDFIEINFKNEAGLNATNTVQIFNIFGLEVYTTQIGRSELLKIDVSHLPSGVYFVKIGDKFEKFVKL